MPLLSLSRRSEQIASITKQLHAAQKVSDKKQAQLAEALKEGEAAAGQISALKGELAKYQSRYASAGAARWRWQHCRGSGSRLHGSAGAIPCCRPAGWLLPGTGNEHQQLCVPAHPARPLAAAHRTSSMEVTLTQLESQTSVTRERLSSATEELDMHQVGASQGGCLVAAWLGLWLHARCCCLGSPPRVEHWRH